MEAGPVWKTGASALWWIHWWKHHNDDKVTALAKCACLGRHHSAGMTMVFVNVTKKPNNSDYKWDCPECGTRVKNLKSECKKVQDQNWKWKEDTYIVQLKNITWRSQTSWDISWTKLIRQLTSRMFTTVTSYVHEHIYRLYYCSWIIPTCTRNPREILE